MSSKDQSPAAHHILVSCILLIVFDTYFLGKGHLEAMIHLFYIFYYTYGVEGVKLGVEKY